MKNIHVQNSSENRSTRQPDEQQLSLFEWAGLPDDSPEKLDRIRAVIEESIWALVERSGIFEDSSHGFAVRNGL